MTIVYREIPYKNLTTMLSGALGVSETPAIRMLLDEVDWNSGLASSLQQSTLNSSQLQLCVKDFTAVSLSSAPRARFQIGQILIIFPQGAPLQPVPLPSPSCKFVPKNKCELTAPKHHSCCSAVSSSFMIIVNLALVKVLMFISVIFIA